jgi:hypothetical protein
MPEFPGPNKIFTGGYEKNMRERALLMRGIAVGGDLALVGANLQWRRSKYGALGLVLDKGPARLDIWLGDLIAIEAGRKVPWTEVILSLLTWGLIIPALLLRPTLWLGPFNLLLMAFNGSYRRTLEIRTLDGTFHFSVKSPDEWLQHLEDSARNHGAGSPVITRRAEAPNLTPQVVP